LRNNTLLLLVLLTGQIIRAQDRVVQFYDLEAGKVIHRFKSDGALKLTKGLEDYFASLREDGFLAATADSFAERSDTLIYFLRKGSKWKWARLYNINADELALSNAGFRERQYRNRSISYRKVASVMEKTLNYYENHGYPFASVRLDSIQIEDDLISAGISAKPGMQIRIDSLNWRGSAKITRKYVYNYLGIKPGDLYNEAAIRQLSSRLREIPFLTETRPPEIFLMDELALIRLHLNGRKASNFSGMIGFLPNNDQTGRLLLTGEAVLKLKNGLGRGESIDAEWRRLQAETQSLNIRLSYPFLLDLPVGLDGTFNLYKRDTTFINLQQNIGVQYLMRGTDYLKAYFENKSSRLLSTVGLQNLLQLPDYADVRSNVYGLEFNFTRLDYRYNPRKGIRMLLRAGAGNRIIDRNPALKEELYNNLVLRSVQYNGMADIDWFIPLFRQSTFNIGMNAAFLAGSNLFENELHRIGGNISLRGFDEESIFASSFAILNLEYRFLTEENSFLFLFGNGAWYENIALNRNVRDLPYGFGVGTSFETRAGIFTISYALGSQFGNPIAFRTAKVHFGITSLF
jgi:outer membrane protein assembly factor BamA